MMTKGGVRLVGFQSLRCVCRWLAVPREEPHVRLARLCGAPYGSFGTVTLPSAVLALLGCQG